MQDNAGLLRSVIDHASAVDVDYDDIADTVEALADSGDLGLVPRLHEALDRFLDDENFYGRDLIATVLAGVAGVAALPALLLAAGRDLGDDQDGLRSDIDELLTDDPATARALILDLIGSDVPERRRAGLLALGDIAEAGDVALLAEAAGHPDPEVRLTAVEAVVDPATDDRAFAVLTGALQDGDAQVRLAAISRLGAGGRPDAVAALEGVQRDADPAVRDRLAYALGRLGSAAATPALLRLRGDGDRQVRDRARDALGSIGTPAAVDALLADATDPDARVRGQAAKALAKAADADPRVAPRLTLLARDDDPAVRAATLSGLASVSAPSPRWSTLVAALADDPDTTVRQRVAVLARLLAPDDADAILRRLADDPEAIVRQATRAGVRVGERR